jgi:ABC-type multidrug transport system ATPase subunit
MTLLVFQGVTKWFAEGRREAMVLRGVSFDVDAGELVAVWGLRRSGRTTLLRLAAGMIAPDEGSVAFRGQDLAQRRGAALGTEIGYCSPCFSPEQGGTVRDHVAVGLLAQRVPRDRARRLAEAELERVGASACANRDPRDLRPDELVRSGIARALVGKPRLLLLDEPTSGVDLLERDPIVGLLRSLADEGIAVLMTTGEMLGGLDRLLLLDQGELRDHRPPEQAPVVPIRRTRSEPSA